jgi:enhancer-of-filamentation protein 1
MITSVRVKNMYIDTDRLSFFYLFKKMQLAIALYNNDVDDEDELEFRKGDVLTVLIENPNGLNGWWLCEHKGKCGLCPGNRLKLTSNTVTSTIKSTEPVRSSCLSTASVS